MRIKKVIINIIFATTNKIAALLCGLIVPRLILITFGSEYNGVINSATQFMSYITILTVGIAGPTRVALYKSLADNDRNRIGGIIKATNVYMRKVAIGILIYAIFIMIIFPYIAETSLDHMSVSTLIAIVAFSLFIEYFFTVTNHNLLIADQKEYIFNISNTIGLILNCIITYILIIWGADIIIVKTGSAIAFLIVPIIISLYVRYKYPWLDRNNLLDTSALKQRGAAAATSIANIVHNSTDLVILTFFEDIKVASVYTVYNMVVSQIRSVLEVFTGSLEAGFGNIMARNEKEVLKRNFKIYEFLIFAFVSVIISCVFVLIIPFVVNYTNGITDVNYIVPSFAFLMTLAEATYCIRQPYVTLVQAAGKYKETRNGAVIEAVLNIGLSVLLVYMVGFQGVVIGTIVANVFRSVQYCIYVYRNILDLNIFKTIGKLVWCVSNNIIIFLAANVSICILGLGDGWMNWIVRAVVTFVLAMIVTTVSSIIFYKEELRGVKEIWHKVMEC